MTLPGPAAGEAEEPDIQPRPERHVSRLIMALSAGVLVVLILAVFLVVRLATVGTSVDPPLSDTTTTPPPPTTSTHTTTPPTTPPVPVELSISCVLDPTPSHRGQRVTLTYTIDSPKQQRVGLGAGVRRGNTDYSNGDGDMDSVSLKVGRQTISRPLFIPDHAPSGRYEINGEIWPENQVGQDGVDTLADQPCDTVTIR